MNESYEVIVVDNGSTDKTGRSREKLCSRNRKSSLFIGASLGLSNARNRGYREAKSDWVVYWTTMHKRFQTLWPAFFLSLKITTSMPSAVLAYRFILMGNQSGVRYLYYSNQELLPKIGELSEKDF